MISKNQIKQVKSLHLKKFREQNKLFIAEGVKIAEEILKYRREIIHEIYVTEEYYSKNRALISGKYFIINQSELEKISTLSTPNQILIICHYFPTEINFTDPSKHFTLYLDNIRDPGNMGTLLRTADWFGMSEIFASEQSIEIYNTKTIQAAMGAFLRVKVHYLPIQKIIEKYKFPVYGAVLNGKNIYSEKLKHGLIVIGNEANGISNEVLNCIDNPITIPSANSNHTESLNAAVAASIICSEFYRSIQL